MNHRPTRGAVTPALWLLASLLLCLLAQSASAEPTQRRKHRPAKPAAIATPASPQTPERLAQLGRYVALAPRCNVRNPLWAERLDVALSQAITEAGADPTAAQLQLASAELKAMDDLKTDSAALCRSLAKPPATRDLRRADELMK